MNLDCFKAYDIRGRVPEELDDGLAWRVGRAYADEINPGTVVVGYDVRLESPMIARALMRGLTEGDVNVIDIGLCGTEEVYFQTFHREKQGVGGGIMITASHNPKGYNGMKLVREGARPISGDSGLFAIRKRVAKFPGHCLAGGCVGQSKKPRGNITVEHNKSAYITHLLSYVDRAALSPLKIIANPGNGAAAPIMRLLKQHLPFEIILIQDEPDGNFPNGVPNPLLPENRAATAKAVIEHGADLGIAWDGDCDRCFLFDAQGRFIEGYYLVGLMAEVMLAKQPGAKIIHDPRLTWNTIDQVKQAGGIPVQSKTGHAFIKERMRKEDAVYGGEMSAHHYFREFAYCDSGMIPWLLVAELMCTSNSSVRQGGIGASRGITPLADLVDARMKAYPCSGERNYRVGNVPASIERVIAYFQSSSPLANGPHMEMFPIVDNTDGVSIEFPDWRFNLRSSNTESLMRLNVESRGDAAAVACRVAEIETLIEQR